MFCLCTSSDMYIIELHKLKKILTTAHYVEQMGSHMQKKINALEYIELILVTLFHKYV